MRRNQQLEAVLGELRAAGITNSEVHQNTHTHIRWRGPTGIERVCVVAGTSRSASGVANARATVRRMLRQDGVL
jgi:cob(I)alamin adenosyltransferase